MFGVLLGLVFLAFNAWTFGEHYLLKHQSVPVQGSVLRTAFQRHKGSITYSVDYVFNVSGRHFEGSGGISRDAFVRLQPGSPIALFYVPDSPNISETAEMSHNNTSLFLTGVLGFPASLFILFVNLRPAFRQQRPKIIDPLPETPPSSVRIEMPNTVKGIAFTVYPVTDMARARQFYEENLGLRVAHDFRGEWIEYHLWDNCFALSSMTGEAMKPSSEAGGSVAFEVNDVDRFVTQLRNKGVRVKVDPFSTSVCRMAVVLDPEGNALTLHQKRA